MAHYVHFSELAKWWSCVAPQDSLNVQGSHVYVIHENNCVTALILSWGTFERLGSKLLKFPFSAPSMKLPVKVIRFCFTCPCCKKHSNRGCFSSCLMSYYCVSNTREWSLFGRSFLQIYWKVNYFQIFSTRYCSSLFLHYFLFFLIAFVAALYVDKGLRYVETFCYVCLFPRLEVNKLSSLVLLESHFGSGFPTTSTLKMRSIALSGIWWFPED